MKTETIKMPDDSGIYFFQYFRPENPEYQVESDQPPLPTNPLDIYTGTVLFPDKVEQAKEDLKNITQADLDRALGK